MPGVTDYYDFIASHPPLKRTPVPPTRIAKRISALAPAEVCRAHIFHSPEAATGIARVNANHLFIYRDLRDVCVSEMFYLRYKAKWHHLHPHFRDAASERDALLLSINGLPAASPIFYPNIHERWRLYRGWLSNNNCHAVRFESLVGEERFHTIRNILLHFQDPDVPLSSRGASPDLSSLAQELCSAVNPHQSHTFRSGKTASWQRHFDRSLTSTFDDVAGESLSELGYS